jgi:hypothetical protein
MPLSLTTTSKVPGRAAKATRPVRAASPPRCGGRHCPGARRGCRQSRPRSAPGSRRWGRPDPPGSPKVATDPIARHPPRAAEAGRRRLARSFRCRSPCRGQAVAAAGFDFVRVDTAAPYRKVALTSWIEDCAAWCSGGWREARPQLRGLLDRWLGFHRTRISEAQARDESQRLTQLLWSLRVEEGLARDSWRGCGRECSMH